MDWAESYRPWPHCLFPWKAKMQRREKGGKAQGGERQVNESNTHEVDKSAQPCLYSSLLSPLLSPLSGSTLPLLFSACPSACPSLRLDLASLILCLPRCLFISLSQSCLAWSLSRRRLPREGGELLLPSTEEEGAGTLAGLPPFLGSLTCVCVCACVCVCV